MIWDYRGRRPLPINDYVISTEGSSCLLNRVSKVTNLCEGIIRPMKSRMLKPGFQLNYAIQEVSNLLKGVLKTKDHPGQYSRPIL